jgi:outer membrane protein OmpA-like peptidoglycan-associated protein
VFTVGIKSVLDFTSRLSLKKRTDRRDIILASKTEKKEHLSLLASRVEERIDYDNLTYEKKRVVEKMVANRIQGVPDKAGQFTDLSAREFAMLSQLAEERYQAFLQQKDSDNRYLARVTSPEDAGQDISITGTLLDSATRQNLASLKILLIDSLGEVLKTTESNESGKFRFTGVPAAQELYLRLERTSHGDLKPLISDIAVKGSATKRTLHFENIYFDFDHYRIRPEAAKVLDDLAEQLIRNPDVQLEIYAFADDRGSNQYNLRLTQKRGQSVVDYLIGRGVDQTGVAIIAKGKQAQQESSGLELQRQFNRRVELYLNGTASIAEETVKTYILKKQIDWSTLSNLTGIAKEKLKMLNGSTDEQLKAFQPVRIPEHAKGISSQLFFIGI